MERIITGITCVALGYAFTKFGLPLPAPNHWFGVLCINLITLGYYLGGAR